MSPCGPRSRSSNTDSLADRFVVDTPFAVLRHRLRLAFASRLESELGWLGGGEGIAGDGGGNKTAGPMRQRVFEIPGAAPRALQPPAMTIARAFVVGTQGVRSLRGPATGAFGSADLDGLVAAWPPRPPRRRRSPGVHCRPQGFRSPRRPIGQCRRGAPTFSFSQGFPGVPGPGNLESLAGAGAAAEAWKARLPGKAARRRSRVLVILYSFSGSDFSVWIGYWVAWGGFPRPDPHANVGQSV